MPGPAKACARRLGELLAVALVLAGCGAAANPPIMPLNTIASPPPSLRPRASVVPQEMPPQQAHAAERTDSISASEAAHYVGQTKTVCGVVASSKFAQTSNGSPTFLNLDRAYPNQVFTAVIWGADRGKFKESPEVAFQGKRICITGPIRLYRDVPEIIVASPSQLRLDSVGREGRTGSDAGALHALAVSPGAQPVASLPEHAHISPLFGDRWECDRGYRQVGDRCDQVTVPANAHISPFFGDRWECN